MNTVNYFVKVGNDMILPKDDNIPVYIGDAISSLERLVINDQYHVIEKMMKFTKGEIFILKILLKRNAPVSPSELSEALNSSKSRISAILKSLENKGEIKREIDPSNRRNILVSLTDTGREHIMSELMIGYHSLASAFAKLGKEDTTEFIRLIEKLFHSIPE